MQRHVYLVDAPLGFGLPKDQTGFQFTTYQAVGNAVQPLGVVRIKVAFDAGKAHPGAGQAQAEVGRGTAEINHVQPGDGCQYRREGAGKEIVGGAHVPRPGLQLKIDSAVSALLVAGAGCAAGARQNRARGGAEEAQGAPVEEVGVTGCEYTAGRAVHLGQISGGVVGQDEVQRMFRARGKGALPALEGGITAWPLVRGVRVILDQTQGVYSHPAGRSAGGRGRAGLQILTRGQGGSKAGAQ